MNSETPKLKEFMDDALDPNYKDADSMRSAMEIAAHETVNYLYSKLRGREGWFDLGDDFMAYAKKWLGDDWSPPVKESK